MTSWRKASRPVAGLEELAGRLQARDRLIIDALGRYKVLTKAQVARLFFDSESSARDRLSTLTELDVVMRYRGHNRQAWRYTLAYWGACVHAVATDPDAKTPTKKAVFDAATRIMHSSHRAHTEAANDFFTRLTASCRNRQGWVVERWLSSAEASLFFDNTKPRPDGGATIRMDDDVLEFWFEHDTGTEPLHVLVDKVNAYDKEYDHAWRRYFTPVLFQLDKPGRENHFHHTLALWRARNERRLPFAIATTVTGLATDPTDQVWWRHGQDKARVRLDEIPPAAKRLDSLEFMKYCRSDDARPGGWI